MDYETAQKVERGEMPDDWYRIAHDERELVSIIIELSDGGTIGKDAPFGSGFHFGLTVGGKFYFATDEFLDDACERDNPDFHEARYESATTGVRDFKINGKTLIEAVSGRRIAQSDAPNVYAD